MSDIVYQNGKFIATGYCDKPIKLPSQMYPVSGEAKMFYTDNTEDCADEEIIAAFNNVSSLLGHCYTNTENFIDELATRGIDKSRMMSYVGWLFMGISRPVHHCFTAVDGKYIFDFATGLKSEHFIALANMPPDNLREALADQYAKTHEQPNSVRFGKGKVDPFYCYIASPCSPTKGREIYNKLMRAFPKHPSYDNLSNPHSYSKTQELSLVKAMRNHVAK